MRAQLVGDRFLLLDKLGEGAASVVYEAAVTNDCSYAKKGDRVAIKLFKSWVLDQPGQAQRIDRELRIGTTIDSPHLVNTYDVGIHEDSLFLVMQVLKGKTLTRWGQDNPRPKFSEVITITRDVLAGLIALHERGLIHRDIKPDNIMVVDGRAVVMDLGVMKENHDAAAITGQKFLGTIQFAAPEFLFGRSYEQSIDIYSLGASLHQVLGDPLIPPNTFWSIQILHKGGLRAPSDEERDQVITFGLPNTNHWWAMQCIYLANIVETMTRDADRPTARQLLDSLQFFPRWLGCMYLCAASPVDALLPPNLFADSQQAFESTGLGSVRETLGKLVGEQTAFDSSIHVSPDVCPLVRALQAVGLLQAFKELGRSVDDNKACLTLQGWALLADLGILPENGMTDWE
jgi:serine/threonine protein kinase